MSLVEEAKTVRQRIVTRLRELEPLVREYHELRQLAAEMGIDEPATATNSPAAPAPLPAALPARAETPQSEPQPVAAPKPAPAATSRPGPAAARSRRSPGRRDARAASATPEEEISSRVLSAVSAEPGRTVAEYAEMLEISPAALYRPVRELTNSGALVKRSRALYPA